jgi:hypothetical protein
MNGGGYEKNIRRNRRDCLLRAVIWNLYVSFKTPLCIVDVLLAEVLMKFTIEELINLIVETIGTCFVITMFWQFITGESAYSLAKIVEKMVVSLGG